MTSQTRLVLNGREPNPVRVPEIRGADATTDRTVSKIKNFTNTLVRISDRLPLRFSYRIQSSWKKFQKKINFGRTTRNKLHLSDTRRSYTHPFLFGVRRTFDHESLYFDRYTNNNKHGFKAESNWNEIRGRGGVPRFTTREVL